MCWLGIYLKLNHDRFICHIIELSAVGMNADQLIPLAVSFVGENTLFLDKQQNILHCKSVTQMWEISFCLFCKFALFVSASLGDCYTSTSLTCQLIFFFLWSMWWPKAKKVDDSWSMTLLHVLSVFCTTLLLMTLLHVLSVVWDWTVTRVTSDSHSYCPCWLKSIPIL